MKILLLAMLLLVSCGKKKDGPSTVVNFISAHPGSDSYYLHFQKGGYGFRKIDAESFDSAKMNLPVYILEDSHDTFSEEELRVEIQDLTHTLYKCATNERLQSTANAGMTGTIQFRNLECFTGEWY